METLEKFVDVLHGARGNMEGHVTLAQTELGPQLENMKGPADYQSAGRHEWSSSTCTSLIYHRKPWQ